MDSTLIAVNGDLEGDLYVFYVHRDGGVPLERVWLPSEPRKPVKVSCVRLGDPFTSFYQSPGVLRAQATIIR